MLSCREFTDGRHRLKGDLDVVCGGEQHAPYELFAKLFICVYPVGVPLLLLIDLLRAKLNGRLYEQSGTGELVPHTSMAYAHSMYKAYDSEAFAFLFEVVHLWFKACHKAFRLIVL